LMNAHSCFRLLPETLFITVNLLDRYLSHQQMTKDDMQLLGITCLYIAAKYEEIYPPQLMDFVAYSKNAVNKNSILVMEKHILRVIQFQVSQTSPYRFLERYSKVAKVA